MALGVKKSTAKARGIRDTGSFLGWEAPLEEGMAACSGILPGEPRGQRSLVGYSLWGHKESEMN